MISIIIPTYNRCSSLESTLHSIMKSSFSHKQFEIIVVDNGSTDATKDITFKLLANSVFNFKYVFEPEPGLLSGRHRGVEESVGDVLTFIDDDVEVSPNWLNAIFDSFNQHSNVSLLTGPCLPKYEVYPPDWVNYFWLETPYGGKECSWLSLMDLGNKVLEIHPNWVWGLNFSIRKKAFINLKGFYPDNIRKELQKFQGNGETGLTIKAGKQGLKALYHPDVLLYHQVSKDRLTKEYFKRRGYYSGVSASYTDLREGKVRQTSPEKDKTRNDSARGAKMVKKKLRHLYLTILRKKTKVEINSDLKLLLIEIKEEVKKGYDFHQHAFNTDDKIKKWVLKENYLNYKLPDTIENE